MAALRLGGFAFLLLAWALAATQFEPVRLPGPEAVYRSLVDNFFVASRLQFQGIQGGLLANVLYTVRNAFESFVIGAGLGFLVGILSARVQWLRDTSAVVLVLFAAVPDLVVFPFLIIWLGPGGSAQRILVLFFAFVSVGLSSQNAAMTLDPCFEESAATLGASSPTRVRTVLLPACLPATIGVVRVALASAWGLQTIGELLGSNAGVGRVIVYSQQLGDTSTTIAAILLLAGFAIVIDLIVISGLRWLTRWQASVHR
jgi:ABC-type nitrate/sulfonate/bicarbonate transport system permease component